MDVYCTNSLEDLHDYANIMLRNSYATLRLKIRKPLSNSRLNPKMELLLKNKKCVDLPPD